MNKVSKSSERNTFQVNAYIERCKEKGEEPSEAYIEMYKKETELDNEWAKEEHKNNLEYDLRTTDWILAKARASDAYAQNIYAALCNMRWQKLDVIPILKDELCSYSWRYAGGIVADMLEKGDYIDWYCSGIGGLNQEYDGNETNEEWQARTGYVPESHITEEIRADFQKLGWVPVPWDDEDLTK
jgi:hypothetical protein